MEGLSLSHEALGSVLLKLAALLGDEYRHLKGVRREMGDLRMELIAIYAWVEKFMTKEDPDIQVRAYARELRELAYDIEDCVNEFMHGVVGMDHEQHHTPAGGIKELFLKSVFRVKALSTRHQIASQIQELKARVIQVGERCARYRSDDVACSSSSSSSSSSGWKTDPRLCALFVEEAKLVGVDGPRDDHVRWMLEGEAGSVKHLKVLSIFGFGGAGKTTLAKEVHQKIKKQFDCQVFVSVSQKPDMMKILWDMLSGLADSLKERETDDQKRLDFPKESRTYDQKRLIEKLRELLQNNRYLITIDDLWSIAAWEQVLKCALPDNDRGSRVITTTRIESVARACCTHPGDLCHKIEPLSESQSRSLFFKRNFCSENGCPPQLKDVSAKILKKCGGLPLAIVSIASLLVSKSSTKEEWEKVAASIGSALENNPNLEGMKAILSLSYNDLPHHLKACLLYLSIFPEDYTIERVSLVRRWIAEGFIKEQRGQSLEDVAESYFNELINRSIIQPVDISYGGKVNSCRLHDMTLELITSKATEENFVTIVGLGHSSSKTEDVVRRLSVQNHGGEHLLALHQTRTSLSHVRSLTIFGGHCNPGLPFYEFRFLRVLSIYIRLFEEADPKMIRKLHQLKYLRLTPTWYTKKQLPAHIGELRNLETLELELRIRDKQWPRGVTRLQKLRHLAVTWQAPKGVTRGSMEDLPELPQGIGRMTAMETLPWFSVCDSPISAVQELGSLTNLKELFFSWDQAEPSDARYKEYLTNSLSKLSNHNLRSLAITSKKPIPVDFLASLSPPPLLLRTFWMWDSYFRKCPEWIAPLSNLVELKLDVWELDDDDLRVLGELPSLLVFHLWVVPLRRERIAIPRRGFQSTVSFCLYSGLPCLSFQESSMPKLENLELRFGARGARSYGRTHSGIQHLRSLKCVTAEIYRHGARASDCKAAVRALKAAVSAHPDSIITDIMEGHQNTSGYYEGSDADEENSDGEASSAYDGMVL